MLAQLKFKYFRLFDGQEDGEGEEEMEGEDGGGGRRGNLLSEGWWEEEEEQGVKKQILEPSLKLWRSGGVRGELKEQGEHQSHRRNYDKDGWSWDILLDL